MAWVAPPHTAQGLEKKPETIFLAFLVGMWPMVNGLWDLVLFFKTRCYLLSMHPATRASIVSSAFGFLSNQSNQSCSGDVLLTTTRTPRHTSNMCMCRFFLGLFVTSCSCLSGCAPGSCFASR